LLKLGFLSDNGARNSLPKIGSALGKVVTKIKKAEDASSEGEKDVTAHPEKVFLKAMPLRSLEDMTSIKQEINSGNIVILKVSPLAKKSIDDVKRAVNELLVFAQSVGGDIARLGEERVVITPSSIRIWREKTATSKEALPTSA
jgi:SepF-like predicted cell division protein (DUF552 family)